MALDEKTIKMAKGPNYAALTTLFKDGSPQTHTMWVDTDGEHILINTEIHRVKYKNVKKNYWKKKTKCMATKLRRK